MSFHAYHDINGHTITAVGGNAEIDAYTGENTEVIDLGGRGWHQEKWETVPTVNIMTIPEEQIPATGVDVTIIGGEVNYRR